MGSAPFWCELGGSIYHGRSCWSSFGLNALVDLFAMDIDVRRSVDANADLITLYAQHGHGDIISNLQTLAYFAGQYQHVSFPAVAASSGGC